MLSFFPPNFLLPCPPHSYCQHCTNTGSDFIGIGRMKGNSQTINHCLPHTVSLTHPCQNPQTPSKYFNCSMLGPIMGSTINDLETGEFSLSSGKKQRRERGQTRLCSPLETVEGGDVFLASYTGILSKFFHKNKETFMSLGISQVYSKGQTGLSELERNIWAPCDTKDKLANNSRKFSEQALSTWEIHDPKEQAFLHTAHCRHHSDFYT